MHKKYFGEFFVSEPELKKKIFAAIETITIFEKESYLESPFDANEILENLKPEFSSEEILEHLSKISSVGISEIYSLEVPIIEKLRHTAINLTLIADLTYLMFLAKRIAIRQSFSWLLLVRYLAAIDLIESKLDLKLLHNPDPISQNLSSIPEGNKFNLRLDVTKKAWEEINFISNHETEGESFNNVIRNFDEGIENHLKGYLPNFLLDNLQLLVIEGIVLNIPSIQPNLLDDVMTQREINSFFDKILKVLKQKANRRVGRTHGGSRRKEGKFSWTWENKQLFFKTVESLPKITWSKKEIHIWDFAFNQFENGGIDSINSDRRFDQLPEALLKEALSEWKKYQDSSQNLKETAKPRMFLFRHALQILEFPESYKFSTFQTHYEAGKKLCAESDFQTST